MVLLPTCRKCFCQAHQQREEGSGRLPNSSSRLQRERERERERKRERERERDRERGGEIEEDGTVLGIRTIERFPSNFPKRENNCNCFPQSLTYICKLGRLSLGVSSPLLENVRLRTVRVQLRDSARPPTVGIRDPIPGKSACAS